jgi:hypothetical protein
MKSEVYSWRLASHKKTVLENAARREGTTVEALLDRITNDWIESKRNSAGDEAEQARLHARAHKTLGAISGSDPKRAERARVVIRKRLRRGR